MKLTPAPGRTHSRSSLSTILGLTVLLALLALQPALARADHDVAGVSASLSSGSGLGLSAELDDGLGMLGPSPTALGTQTGTAAAGPGAGLGTSAAPDPTSGDFRSANFHKLDREEIRIPGGGLAQGSDLAFRGNVMIAGAYEGVGFFRIGDDGDPLRQLSFFDCPGSQGDVVVSGDHLFVSVDSRGSNGEQTPTCNNTATTESPSSVGKEGLRIVDISDVRNPRQVGFVETECGSHTQTLIPGRPASFIYVDSYPLGADTECTEANHPEGEFSVVRFPTDNPRRARVVAVPDVLPPEVTPDTVGCHDTGVLPAKRLAVAACLGAFAVMDISNPARPKTLSHAQNPAIELDHSAQLTWDGKYAVIGDEHAGAAGGGGCSPDQASPVGAMWFYDITDRRNPTLEGSYSLPRVPPVDTPEEVERFRCTTHNYMVLPMADPDRYVAVSPYYSGGLSVVDFSDPAQPQELGYYLPQIDGENPDMWSGYWYDGRIYTNEHASQFGVSAFEMDGLGTAEVLGLGARVNPQTQVRPAG
jgi:hypothetical protein